MALFGDDGALSEKGINVGRNTGLGVTIENMFNDKYANA